MIYTKTLAKKKKKNPNYARTIPGRHTRIEGLEQVDKVIDIDQSPIEEHRVPIRNIYGAFDLIRDLFVATPDAKGEEGKKEDLAQCEGRTL